MPIMIILINAEGRIVCQKTYIRLILKKNVFEFEKPSLLNEYNIFLRLLKIAVNI